MVSAGVHTNTPTAVRVAREGQRHLEKRDHNLQSILRARAMAPTVQQTARVLAFATRMPGVRKALVTCAIVILLLIMTVIYLVRKRKATVQDLARIVP